MTVIGSRTGTFVAMSGLGLGLCKDQMRRLDDLAYPHAPPARKQAPLLFLYPSRSRRVISLFRRVVYGKQKELDMLATALLAATLGVAAQPELQNVNCDSYGYASACDAYGYAPYYGYTYRRYVGPRRFGRFGHRGFYGNPDRTFGRHCHGASC